MTLKSMVGSAPVIGAAARGLWYATRPIRFRIAGFRSATYWDDRYSGGGNSGVGSYGDLASFKARVLNSFVAEHDVTSVVEFGCGDGNQLALAQYPQYVGYDVSPNAIKRCQKVFAGDESKRFMVFDKCHSCRDEAELALSLDVIYHLVEDDVFERHMRTLFEAATRFVIIYSDNEERPRQWLHVRHRRFSVWIQQNCSDWRLVEHIPNELPYDPDVMGGSWADFWVYGRRENKSPKKG